MPLGVDIGGILMVAQVAFGMARGTAAGDDIYTQPYPSYNQMVMGWPAGSSLRRPNVFWRVGASTRQLAASGPSLKRYGTPTWSSEGVPLTPHGSRVFDTAGQGYQASYGVAAGTDFTIHAWFTADRYVQTGSQEPTLIWTDDWQISRSATDDNIRLYGLTASPLVVLDSEDYGPNTWMGVTIEIKDGASGTVQAWRTLTDGTQTQTLNYSGQVTVSGWSNIVVGAGWSDGPVDTWSGKIDLVAIYESPSGTITSDTLSSHAALKNRYADVTDWVISAATKRGRSSASDQFEAGQAMITLNNCDGRFSPEQTSGWSVDDETNTCEIQPGKWARILTTTANNAAVAKFDPGSQASFTPEFSSVFVGQVAEWDDIVGVNSIPTAEVALLDATALLSLERLSITTTTGAAHSVVTEVLDKVGSAVPGHTGGWPSTLRSLETDGVTISSFATVDEPIWSILRRVAETEGGRIYIDAYGRVRFETRNYRNDRFVAGAEVTLDEIREIDWEFNDELLRTQIRVQDSTGEIAQLDASDELLRRYGVRRKDITVVEGQSTELLLDYAGVELGRAGRAIRLYRHLVMHGRPTAGWLSMLTSTADPQIGDISTALTATVKGAPAGTLTSPLLVVEGVSHTLLPGRGWKTELQVYPAAYSSFWALADADLGRLGITTRIAPG